MLALSPPALASLPGAAVTLYIDFDGAPAFERSSHQWASGPAPGDNDPIPAFSIDSDATDFSDAELDAIISIWRYTSEKYSPFEINVTTLEPLNLNDGEAVRIVVGGSASDWYDKDVGGVAFFNAFTGPSDNTGFVFSADSIDSGSTTLSSNDLRFLGETIAHEAGHTFGLEHQSDVDAMNNVVTVYSRGTSTTAPIMGGSSNANGKRGIWLAGTASKDTTDDDIDNPTYAGVQDDLATLTRPGNHIEYRADDWGEYSGSGTLAIDPGTGLGEARGVIERQGDRDGFSFEAVGNIMTITVNNAAEGGMLAPTLNLVGVSGDSPTFTVTTTNTSATLTTSNAVPGHGYVLQVSAKDNAYGSLGQYTVSANVGSFATLLDGKLNVLGYHVDNDLLLSYIPSTDRIVIQDNVLGGQAVQQFPRTAVSEIVVALAGRATDDRISVLGAFSSLPIKVWVSAGDGNDTLQIDGATGNDVLGVDSLGLAHTNATPIWFSGVETVAFSGFDGNDTFNFDWQSEGVRYVVHGDGDDDVVNLAPNAPYGISQLNGAIEVFGGAGADTLNVGSGGLHAVSGLVTFNGGAQGEGNRINLWDGANAFFLDYTITDSSIVRDEPFFFGGVNFSNVGAVFLDATQGPNRVYVSSSTLSSVIVNGNDGNDEVVIGNGSNLASGIGQFTGNGGLGIDKITLDDSQSTHNLPWAVLGDASSDPRTVYLGLRAYDTEGFESVEVRA
ncbi:MAG: hypothetical protein KDA61_08005, partial [Planctomycetales bacterium]|nr:hypothetical protein [Planctomycetales bacterium]